MEESPRHSAKRFGWIEPSPEKGEGHVNVVIHGRDLSEAEWVEFKRIISVAAELRPYVIDFLVLERDFHEIDRLEATLAAELQATPFLFLAPGAALTGAYVTAQRALSNFLAAASAFRDRGRVRLIELYGEKSTQVQAFETAVKGAYDCSFAYRLLYNLRNYAQHHASPINVIPIQGTRSDEGKMLIAVRIELQRDELLAKGKKIQPRVRKELADKTATIPLAPLARDYMRLHGRILTAIVGPQMHRLATFTDYARVIIRKSGMPTGAVPVIWEGPPPEAPEYRSDVHHFSFDELAFLTSMIFRLRTGHVED